MYNRNTNTISLIVQSPIAPRSNNVLWDDGTSIKIWRKGIWVPIGGGGSSDSYWGYDEVDNTVFITGYNKVQINCDLVVNGNISSKNWNDMWELSEDGTQIFTTKQVLIKNSLIVEGDTSSGGAGEDTPGYGASSMSQLEDVDLSSLGNNYVLIYDSSSSKWVSKPQSEIVPDLSGYLKIEDANTTFVKLDTFNTLSDEVSTLNTKVTLVHNWYNAISPYWYYDTELEAIVCTKNLIVYLDTSSGGEGQDTPASGIRGIYVNGTPYTDTDGDGFIDLGTISGGVSGDYLPLTGGRIKGNSLDIGREDNYAGAFVKIITNASTSADYGTSIRHYEKSSGSYTYKGLLIDKNGAYYSNNGSNYGLIHSGNYSSFALPLSGGTITGNLTLNQYLRINAWSGYGSGSANVWYNGSTKRLLWDNATDMAFGTNIVIHSGNVGSYAPIYNASGNVLIGTTTDDASHKVQIDGTLKVYEPSQRRLYTRFSSAEVQCGVNTSLYTGGWNGGVTVGADNSALGYIAGAYMDGGTINTYFYGGLNLSTAAMRINPSTKAVTMLGALTITGGIAPSANNFYTLGTSSYQWSTVYGVNGNFSGNVGIGTTSPLSKLQVGGQINVSHNSNKNYAFISQDDYTSNTSWMKLGTCYGYQTEAVAMTIYQGMVKIGNAIPTCALDVNGTIATNQYIRINAWTGYGSGSCDMWYDGNATTLEVRSSVKITQNLVVAGDTSSGSDIRFKDIIKNKTLKIEDIAKAPLFTFKWNDREDDTIHLGSSAQYWEKVTPWLVKGEDFKTLDYSTLGVAMGISLAKKAVNHEARIKELEKENKALKEEIRRMQYGS